MNKSGATQAVELDISKAFDRVSHAGLLHKLKSYGISGQIFGDDTMLIILLFILSVTRDLTCGNNLNLLLNLNLIYETLLCTGVSKKRLVDFSAGKTQVVSFERSKNNGSIDVKMDGTVLEEKSSFKMMGLTFSSKLD